ncbi:hypothetical protein ElyMa_004868700 [Elysia marginata]|uniref:PiggyBac transposable element-derived protein domain-containing protein n=1 Tax=Elysia marginata TaxID=1093978 RepID=A0AAV4IRM5_9GAST|nr:hypothetical protein ElyMa_004868700 [Elysia marginata]
MSTPRALTSGRPYIADDKFYNPRYIQAKTKVHTDRLREFLFFDHCALNADNKAEMQHSMNLFSTACDNFGLTIFTKKSKGTYQRAPGKPYTEPTVTLNGVKLAAVDRFTYLGSILSHNVHIDDKTDGRISKASADFRSLRSSLWERKDVSQTIKIKVYSAVVITTLLYASKTCTVCRRHVKKLNRFHLCCLR